METSSATKVAEAISKENARIARSGGDAFPRHQDDYGGLTKREYMATHILAGLSALHSESADSMAGQAVKLADAILAELAK